MERYLLLLNKLKMLLIKHKLKNNPPPDNFDSSPLLYKDYLLKLSLELPDNIFMDVKERTLKRLVMSLNFQNIEELLNVLDIAINCIEEDLMFEQSKLGNRNGYRIVSIDDWLVNNHNRVVKPDSAWHALNERLSLLSSLFNKCENHTLEVSYCRRLKYVLIDTATTMEALLEIVALRNNVKRSKGTSPI